MASQNEKFAAIAAARAAATKAGATPAAVAAAKAAASKAPLREVTTGIPQQPPKAERKPKAAPEADTNKAEQDAAKAERKAARTAAREERAKARAAEKLAKDIRKQKLADIRKEQRALKALGARMTDADKARLNELKAEAHAVRGTGKGKPRVTGLLAKVERLLRMVRREASRYDIGTERGDAFNAHAMLDGLSTSVTEALAVVSDATFDRKVKATSPRTGAAAKPKVVLGSTVTVKAKFFDTYEDVLNVADKFTVQKVVGKRAVVVDSDGTKSAIPLAHLEAA